MKINTKKGLSKKNFILQSKTDSKSGLEEFTDEILQEYRKSNNAFFVLERIGESGLPGFDEQFRIITKRAFNSLEIVRHILNHEKITETYICVYSIDFKSALVLDYLAKEEKLGNVTFLISNLRNSAHSEKEAAVRRLFLKNPKMRLIFAGSHAKLLLFKTNSNNYYVIETSANMASNSRIEQYLFENNEKSYKFHKNWIDNVYNIASERELSIYDYSGEKI